MCSGRSPDRARLIARLDTGNSLRKEELFMEQSPKSPRNPDKYKAPFSCLIGAVAGFTLSFFVFAFLMYITFFN